MLTIRTAINARKLLLSYLDTTGLTYESCTLHLSDEGLNLVVLAPTSTHSQIPKEFHGVPVEVRDSV